MGAASSCSPAAPAALGIAIAVDRTFFAESTRACRLEPTQPSRPALQRILDGLVAGPARLSPGATAYVSGPHGSRLGAAGVEDTWLGGTTSGCADQAYGRSGGGSGYKTEVWVDDNGSRVAVLLLNARHMATAQPAADQAAHDALARLCCSA